MNRYLCKDILYNIFIRLPTTSIVRLIFVCKLWHDILTGSEFWEDHQSRNPYPNLLFFSNQKCVMNLSLNMLKCPEVICRVNHGEYCYGGTSNGLVLLAPVHSCFILPMVIVNPLTGRHFKISSDSKFHTICGFGYSRVSKQYKILTIHCYTDSSNLYTIKVWTLGSPEPPQVVLKDLNYSIDDYVYINGTIYANLFGSLNRILAFDVEMETFKYIECPFGKKISGLMQVRGCLCVASIERPDIFIWMLSDNGWEIIYILEAAAKNLLVFVFGVWEIKNSLLACFLDEKFILYDRVFGPKIMDTGKNTDTAELLIARKEFADTSKFVNQNWDWKMSWGYKPTLQSPKKIFENVEASYGTGSSGMRVAYEQRKIVEDVEYKLMNESLTSKNFGYFCDVHFDQL